MSYLPLIAFFACMAYIIWRGFSEKREFFRQQDEERERSKLAEDTKQTAQTSSENITPRTA